MRWTVLICILFSCTITSAADCEPELDPVRFRDNFRELLRPGAYWDVNPYFYRDIYRGRRIFHLALDQLEKPLRSRFELIDDGMPSAIARYLLMAGAVQARVRQKNGLLGVDKLWLNGRAWPRVLEELGDLRPVQLLTELGNLAQDRTRLGQPPMDTDSMELEKAAVDGSEIDVFTHQGREAQALQLVIRKRILEDLEQFMDYRSANEVLAQMIREHLIFAKLDITRAGVSIESIRVVDEYGFKRPLHLIIEELRKRCIKSNEARARAARPPLVGPADRTPRRLVSPIYDRPESVPMDRTFWKKFSGND